MIGAVIGFAVGQYWQLAGFRLQRRTVTIQQTLAEKQLYERLQLLQQQAADAIPRYIVLRDQRFAASSEPVTRDSHAKGLELSSAYEAEKSKLVSTVCEYNRLEVKLAEIEKRSPHFFVLPLPPMVPKNLRLVSQEGRTVTLAWDPPDPDPVRMEVEKDLRDLFHQEGHEYPSDEKGSSP